MRFNEYRSAQLNGAASPGFSTDQAMKALEETFAQTMPAEMGFDYSGMSFQEKKAQQGVSPAAIFSLSFLFVFLILAALYESWSLPFSVLLGTPIAVLGAFGALWSRHMVNNVFAQIGLVMLIGLAAKNAILIVEFARVQYEEGKPLIDAALTGLQLPESVIPGALTVSDGADFAAHGGVIELFAEGNRLRFNINLPSAQRAGASSASLRSFGCALASWVGAFRPLAARTRWGRGGLISERRPSCAIASRAR